MKREQSSGAFLSAVFVDYDNIYLSLKRKSEEAAKRFAKDAPVWLKAIETGSLITPTNGPGTEGYRRIVMNRCYGNPVPRRNQADNSTDMSSFPFVRHHFLRAGFEIVDCPPLTAQLKNSSDIRMVMDVRDFLTHPTYFDEFIILSGDADFTPVLHRLRAHARRTIIFANDFTAAPYTAISDGEIREADLVTLLLEGRVGAETAPAEIGHKPEAISAEIARREIMAEVVAAVRAAPGPLPLEVLADRAIRQIGHDKTVGTGWGGAGGFRELLAQELPEGLRLSGEPPYVVIDQTRHIVAAPAPIQIAPAAAAPAHAAEIAEPRFERAMPAPQQPAAPIARESYPARMPAAQAPVPQFGNGRIATPVAQAQAAAPVAPAPVAYSQPIQPAPPAPTPSQRSRSELVPQAPAVPSFAPQLRASEPQSAIHQSIARIQEACQAPPLAPPEYRALFEAMAQELNERGLLGAQTIVNIAQRAQERGIEVRRDDVRFVLEVVSEADPWFEQGASANLFAGRFRNFVVARCRGQGLNLSADELDLVEAWFAGSGVAAAAPAAPRSSAPAQPEMTSAPAPRVSATATAADPRGGWSLEEGRQHVADQRQPAHAPQAGGDMGEDFPRIVRTRLRG